VNVAAAPSGPWHFTNAGVSGRLGPSQAQFDANYSGSTLAGKVTINTQGIQEWTVPATGTYRIETWGAQGARSDEGFGARMRGDFSLSEDQVLRILVGQRGGSNQPNNTSGGGGSFVVRPNNVPLIVAGGGGNRCRASGVPLRSVTDGSIENNGNSGFYNGSSLNNGGVNGGGGSTNPGGQGGAGGGFSGDGQASLDNRGPFTPANSIGAQSFLNGGVGGWGNMHLDGGGATSPQRFGGFGGGASGGHYGAGAGGGYSGGGSDKNGNTGYAGGGGSYNAGTNKDDSAGVNEGHGKVVITFVGN
jgi:hypothetical protein